MIKVQMYEKGRNYMAEQRKKRQDGEKTLRPALTARDRRDMARRLEAMAGAAENPRGALMFDGEALDEETSRLLRASLQNQLLIGKKLAKQRFTPKKYRRD